LYDGEERGRRKSPSFCGSREIQGHAFIPGSTGFGGNFRILTARSYSYHMIASADHPLKGMGLALRAGYIHFFI
jgi:hypothetical protein